MLCYTTLAGHSATISWSLQLEFPLIKA